MDKNILEEITLGLIAKERDENSGPEDYMSFEEAVFELGLKMKT